jgi:hypothetical protein
LCARPTLLTVSADTQLVCRHLHKATGGAVVNRRSAASRAAVRKDVATVRSRGPRRGSRLDGRRSSPAAMPAYEAIVASPETARRRRTSARCARRPDVSTLTSRRNLGDQDAPMMIRVRTTLRSRGSRALDTPVQDYRTCAQYDRRLPLSCRTYRHHRRGLHVRSDDILPGAFGAHGMPATPSAALADSGSDVSPDDAPSLSFRRERHAAEVSPPTRRNESSLCQGGRLPASGYPLKRPCPGWLILEERPDLDYAV